MWIDGSLFRFMVVNSFQCFRNLVGGNVMPLVISNQMSECISLPHCRIRGKEHLHLGGLEFPSLIVSTRVPIFIVVKSSRSKANSMHGWPRTEKVCLHPLWRRPQEVGFENSFEKRSHMFLVANKG